MIGINHMVNFIFILGTQGAGKTTLARVLKEKLASVYIDFDWIRDFQVVT
jgi:adenylate kinase family enzyme